MMKQAVFDNPRILPFPCSSFSYEVLTSSIHGRNMVISLPSKLIVKSFAGKPVLTVGWVSTAADYKFPLPKKHLWKGGTGGQHEL